MSLVIFKRLDFFDVETISTNALSIFPQVIVYICITSTPMISSSNEMKIEQRYF